MIGGATACLIEGRWLLTGMPLASAVDTLSKATAAEEETSAALAKAARALRVSSKRAEWSQFVLGCCALMTVTMGAQFRFLRSKIFQTASLKLLKESKSEHRRYHQ